MKICLVHNSYEQRGGEDVVFEQERANLVHGGHEVVSYHRSNTEMDSHGALAQITLLTNAVWSTQCRDEFARLLDHEAPDIVHVHNTFFLISPSIYSACKERGIPVVQTLHNYRWICPAFTMYRDGAVCEECLEGSLWNGIRHGCYRNSTAATAGMALILASHRWMKTWDECIDRYIALTEFAREKFIASGLNPEKISVKPNFVETDPGARTRTGNFALYAGRLSEEKGVGTLLDAWEGVAPDCVLQIVGDGPERPALEARAKSLNLSNVVFRGSLSRMETIAAMKQARFILVPSQWYEGFPMVIAEAMACGTPIVCSKLGAMEEIVADGRTGLHFAPGDAADLARTVAWAWEHPADMLALGRAARAEYERKYTAEKNYRQLVDIYEQSLAATQVATGFAIPEHAARI